MGDHFLLHEGVWFDKWKFDDAECKAATKAAMLRQGGSEASQGDGKLVEKLTKLERENERLSKVQNDLMKVIDKLEKRVSQLELRATPSSSPAGAKPTTSAAHSAAKNEPDDDDDEIDLFGSDDDEEEKEKKPVSVPVKKKGATIAKSSVVLDVKPWDDETDMKAIENLVRGIELDGLLWGKSQLVPLAYGIKKFQIGLVCEDEKVSIEELSEKIEAFDELVQSVDVAAFNKI